MMKVLERIIKVKSNLLNGRGQKMKRLLTAIMLLSMAAGTANATCVAYTVQSNGNDNLYRIDLATGAYTRIGPVGYGDVQGLGFDLDGTLYGVEGNESHVVKINATTGQGTLVGTCSFAGIDTGVDVNPDTRRLYAISGSGSHSYLYEINKTTGAAILLASYDVYADSLAIGPGGIAYAADGGYLGGEGGSLYRIDLAAPSTITRVGTLGISGGEQAGLARCPLTDQYYLLRSGGTLYTVDIATGHASLVASTVSLSEGLAIIPEPGMLLLIGLGGVALLRRKRGYGA